MRLLKTYLNSAVLLAGMLLTGTCRGAACADSSIVFVGSTPGDDLIKSLLGIHPKIKVDFIRWMLTLHTSASCQNTFSVTVAFGEAQPNALGFKGGAEKRSFKGTYKITRERNGKTKGEIYHLKSSGWPAPVSLARLNDNLLHLLTPQHTLMVGNGGWSYTLNRKEPVVTGILPSFALSSTLLSDTSGQLIFDGRTPCQGFAAEHQMNVLSTCFKLKWRLVLKRDPLTKEPATYTIRKVVDNIPRDVSGNWTILKETRGNSNAVIYKLDPGDPEKSISLLAADQNVLFFLNKKHELYTGNSDFSFTLNRKR